ncbi:MAG: hypothetical protein ABJ275_01275 [Maricaulaceae bacterium]
MKYTVLIALMLAMTACQKQTNTIAASEPTQVDQVIRVNMTYDRLMPHKATAVTAVPNNVAPWVSGLFIIDEQDQLLRSGLEVGEFKLVATGIKSMAPLARKNAASIIMAQTLDNDVTGYMEINDKGDYKNIPFTKAPQDLSGLCETSALMEQRIYGYDKSKTYALEIINPTENGRVESVEVKNLPAPTDQCLLAIEGNNIVAVSTPKTAINAAQLEPGTIIYTTHESLERPRLFLQKGDVTTAIDITGGLTTAAPTQIDSFTIIRNNLGGVLRNGAVLIADNQSERVIYVSLDLLNRRLNERVSLPTQE